MNKSKGVVLPTESFEISATVTLPSPNQRSKPQTRHPQLSPREQGLHQENQDTSSQCITVRVLMQYLIYMVLIHRTIRRLERIHVPHLPLHWLSLVLWKTCLCQVLGSVNEEALSSSISASDYALMLHAPTILDSVFIRTWHMAESQEVRHTSWEEM